MGPLKNLGAPGKYPLFPPTHPSLGEPDGAKSLGIRLV